MELALKMLGGAVLGGLAGLLLSRARTCSSQGCSARPSRLYSIIAGAVLGAGAGAWLASR